MNMLDDLTPSQAEAVQHGEGPLLILAGAGSGKTRVITRRIAYLMDRGVPAHAILAITFTNKAAGEMRDRTSALVLGERQPFVSTFHSFCARMLREYGDLVGADPRFTIYDAADQEAAVKRALAQLNLDPMRFAPDRMRDRISSAKNHLRRAAEFTAGADDWTAKRIARVYEVYEAALGESNALDFDDLLMKVAIGLRDNPEFRDLLHDRFYYILIDEYQDTNHAQYVIARLLAGRRRNLCATGDPDQSIYGWRGAQISNILDFEKDFPDARVIRLEENWRSTKTILAAASGTIRHNTNRKEKDLYTHNDAGEPVCIVQTDDEETEAASIVCRIERLHADGLPYGGAAVFVRTVAQTRALEDALRRARPPIPYEVVRGTSFYERREVRDVLAYLEVLHNLRDEVNLGRIINTPPRGIGAKTIESLRAWAKREGVSLFEATHHAADMPDLQPRARAAVARFADLMDRLASARDSGVRDLVEAVITKTGYREWLPDDETERRANLDELVTLGARHDALQAKEPDLARGLEGFLETVNLSSDQDGYDESPDRVPLMTLHAAKGLEFPAVFIAGCEEGLLPHERSSDSGDEIEEERRLLFVGMTRAKHHLVLTHARFRRIHGRTTRCVKSPFLMEIPPETVRAEDETSGTSPAPLDSGSGYTGPGPERTTRTEIDSETGLAVGELVRHPTYGLGRVARFKTSGGRRFVRIHFNTVGEKLLDPKFVRLERVAPA
ncbi:MAG: UvrD-helicase domain-containing protein [Phycisphaerae bacterium]